MDSTGLPNLAGGSVPAGMREGELKAVTRRNPVAGKSFDGPETSLAGFGPLTAAAVLAAMADVALVINADGVILDAAFGNGALLQHGYGKWVGQHWIETVTIECRAKVMELLDGNRPQAGSLTRHLNHHSPTGADVPMLYTVVTFGSDGRLLVLGRDQSEIAVMQQRLVEAQQALERDYWRLRQAETRYRLLFQTAADAIVIVDAATECIVEANPAAGQILAEAANSLIGRVFQELFENSGRNALGNLFARVRATGRADDVRLRTAGDGREFLVSGTLYRQERAAFLLIRLQGSDQSAARQRLQQAHLRLIELVEHAPDAFVVTDLEGRIITANSAFIELAQVIGEEQARGESLDRWLGRPGVDLDVLRANVRQHGAVRLFATTMRGDYGAVADVEISAVGIFNGEHPCLGFAIRNVGRRLPGGIGSSQALPRSVQQLTELVGRVPLKDIVRDTTDLIERLCIEAALELTSDNRASAAEMLGLSRQSLYVKLHRYGLGSLGASADR